MKVMIVDDEPVARRTLRECCARQPDIQVIGEHGDGRSALQAIAASSPDLLFLDIQMDGLTGLQVARSLPAASMPLVVFVTAYDQYAVEAFELNATDYLLKPFEDARLHATLVRARRLLDTGNAEQRAVALARLLARLEERPAAALAPARLLGELGGRLHMLDVARIEMIEADRNYVTLISDGERYQVRSTLAQAEEALAGQPMLRISRSCVVNVGFIGEVSRTPRGDFILVTRGGATVTSSEGYRDKVREYLERFRLDRQSPVPPG
jgi:two-component system LytT family response regulator